MPRPLWAPGTSLVLLAHGTPPPGRGRVPGPALGNCTWGWEGSQGLAQRTVIVPVVALQTEDLSGQRGPGWEGIITENVPSSLSRGPREQGDPRSWHNQTAEGLGGWDHQPRPPRLSDWPSPSGQCGCVHDGAPALFQKLLCQGPSPHHAHHCDVENGGTWPR